jgi:hypothetical protein
MATYTGTGEGGVERESEDDPFWDDDDGRAEDESGGGGGCGEARQPGEGTERGAQEESTEGECEDAEEVGGEEGGYSRLNWHADEHIALLWAAIAQSNFKQIQPLAELRKGTATRYLSKAKELVALRRWRCKRAPEDSFEARCKNPTTLWKMQGALRTAIVRDIVPLWTKLKKKQPSGWTKEQYVEETRVRYWREKIKLPPDSEDLPPASWTTNHWEVFMFLGAPGFDEPCLRAGLSPIGPGGKTCSRTAARKRAREDATE